jgi:O-antigen/teichoic acid export membrane protein
VDEGHVDQGVASGTPSPGAIVRGLSWVGAGHVVGQAFWFGSLLLLAALLPPRAFGTVTVGLLMVTAAARLMEAGTRGSIIVASRLTRNNIITSLVGNVGAGVLLSGLIVVVSVPMARTFAHGANPLVLQILGLSVVLYAPAIVPLAMLEKRLQFKRRATVQAGAAISASIVAIAAAAFGAGVWALVIRQLVFQALLGICGWIAARRLVPPRDPRSPRNWARLKRQGAVGFMLFSLTDFVVFNADYLIVGHLTNVAQLGLYSMAFSIAFAPVTQFSSQLGSVFFPAAAASDPETRSRRTILAVRLACFVLLPLVPVAIVLAPVLVPALLGERWRGMVPPFQILIMVGVAHAIVNIIGDSLSGSGQIGFRARLNTVWMFAMLAALVVLVRADGIRGASLAHLIVYGPIAVVYGVRGMHLLGSGPRRLAVALRPVAVFIATQALVTAALLELLSEIGASPAVSAAGASVIGVAAASACLVTISAGALGEMRALLGRLASAPP